MSARVLVMWAELRDALRVRPPARLRVACAIGLAATLLAPRSIGATAQGPLTQVVDSWVLPPRGGWLEVRDGTRVLVLEGDVADRGFAEGFLCADELLECFTEFALGHVVARRPVAWDLVVLPRVCARFVFEADTRRWAEGVVAGAGITLYRCVADLGARTLGLERSTDTGWRPRITLGFGP